MSIAVVIDESTDFGGRAARRLREESTIWLTTVSAKGVPLPRPVWFLWDDEVTVSIYSVDGARVRNIGANPRVTLNLDTDGDGGDIVVLTGTAEIDPDAPAADADPAYLAKYSKGIEGLGMTPAGFAEHYSVPVRIRLTRLDGF